MRQQPKYKPLQGSSFFGDDRSARTPEPGTVPRGEPENLAAVYPDAGKSPQPRWAATLVGLGAGGGLDMAPAFASAYDFPVPVDAALLKRGRQRYDIYCSVCHDRVGTGRGKIVERGYLRPPSYHIDRLREAPLTHFYDVVSNGYGAMPSYSDKLAPDDRWAVIAYIRALQMSQDVPFESLSVEEREKVESKGTTP